MKKTTALIILFIILINTPAYADYKIAEFHDHDNDSTAVFKVKPRWQIKYRVREETHFAIVVRDEYDKYKNLAVNTIGPRKGESYQEKGGTYYLEITAYGHWDIEIHQITGEYKINRESL